MAEPKSEPSANHLSAVKTNRWLRHRKEPHGKREVIDESTSVDEVRAPNVFERVKEEIEALVQTIHPKKESPRRNEVVVEESEVEKPEPRSGSGGIVHHDKQPIRHHKETHGRSSSIDEKTPINKVKGPNIFDRAKEEIEALVHTTHHKKESDSPEREGFGSKIGRGLEKVCSPLKSKNDKSQSFS